MYTTPRIPAKTACKALCKCKFSEKHLNAHLLAEYKKTLPKKARKAKEWSAAQWVEKVVQPAQLANGFDPDPDGDTGLHVEVHLPKSLQPTSASAVTAYELHAVLSKTTGAFENVFVGDSGYAVEKGPDRAAICTLFHTLREKVWNHEFLNAGNFDLFHPRAITMVTPELFGAIHRQM